MSALRGAASVLALVKQPFVTAGRSYNAAAQRNPFLVGTVTTVVKTSAADLFAQKVGRRTQPRPARRAREAILPPRPGSCALSPPCYRVALTPRRRR